MPGRTPVNVERIRELLAQGMTPKAIAERLGCSKSSVWTVAKGVAK
jgi:DNA-binding CsgD family transcriptional regulator